MTLRRARLELDTHGPERQTLTIQRIDGYVFTRYLAELDLGRIGDLTFELDNRAIAEWVGELIRLLDDEEGS